MPSILLVVIKETTEYEEGSIIFSKPLQLVNYLALILALALAGCSIRINEAPVEFRETKINPVKEGCLSDAGTVMQKYFDGLVSEQELHEFWNCLYHSFDLFAHYTKGANEEYYTPQELTGFLKKYFLKGKPIPSGLTEEAMVLKQSILGGATDKLTKNELKLTLKLIRTFQSETIKLRPYMPFGYNVVRSQRLDDETFEKAVSTLNDSMTKIADALQESVGDYSFHNLNALFLELEQFLAENSSHNADWLKIARKYLKVLTSIKSILISPPANMIQAADFRKIFRLAPRYYTLYLRTAYYARTNSSLLSGAGLSYLDNFARDARDAFLESMSYHPKNTISIQEINTLLDALDEHKLLPAKSKVIKEFLPVVFFRLLPSSPEAPPPAFLGISEKSVDYIWQKFRFWSEGQHYLDGMFRELSGHPNPNEKALSNIDILTIFPEDSLKWTMLRNEISIESVKDMQAIVRDVRTVNPPNSSIVEIPEDRRIKYSFSHLSRMNWLRTVARIVLPAYSSDLDRAKNLTGLTSDEANSFYRDVFPLAVDLKLLTPESAGAASARFLEADLFLFNSNGNNVLSVNEILELGAVGISVIIKAADVHEEIAKLCNSAKRDVRGNPVIDANCFKRQFKQNIASNWSQIPGFLRYFNEQNAAKQNNILDSLDAIVRTKEDRRLFTGVTFESGETQGFMLTPYYLEAVIARFDKNFSGGIDQEEAELAFPVFQRFIAEKAKQFNLNDPKDHQAIFTYLLKYGNLPNESLVDEARFAYWRYIDQSSFEVDRYMLIKIFSKLVRL